MSKVMKKSSCPLFKLIAVLSIVFIAVAALILPTYTPASGDTNADSPLPGDMNGDGQVDVLDFILLKLILIGQEPPTDLADVDGNGIINSLDLAALLDQVFGKSASSRGGGGGGGGGGGVPSVTNQVNFELSIYQSTYGPGTTGNTFTARVKIAQTSYLYNGTFTVDYDPLILQVNNVSDGLFATTCVINMTNGIDWTDTPGQLTISPNLSSCAVNGSGISGNGYLCDVTFETRGVGTSPLTLGNGSLYKIQSGNVSAITGTTWINSSAQISQRYILETSSSEGGAVTTPGEPGPYPYNDGQLVNIVATPDSCYHFVNWTGSGVTAGKVTNPNAASTTITMDGDYSVQANFAIDEFDLTTAVTGTGSASGDGTYNCGTLAAITATETDACWVFDHWTGSGITDVNDPTTTVLINGDKTVTAVFVQLTQNLTTAVTGTGSASGDGTYNCGTLAAITATETDACWAFNHWEGTGITNVNAASTTVLMNASKTVTAVFTQRSYTLNTSSDSNGSVTTPGEAGPYSYNCGTNAPIVAEASQCYIFDQWTGTGVTAGKVANPLASSTTILMDGNYSVHATFVVGFTFNLTVAADPIGGGTPSFDGSNPFGCGNIVPIHANPDACYNFVNWTGSPYIANPNSADTTVQMFSEYTVTAHYAIKQYTLTTNVLPSAAATAGCTATGGGVYNCSDNASIQANPASPYSFAYWTSADPAINGSTNLSESVLMDGNKSVTANFVINPNTVYCEKVSTKTLGVPFTLMVMAQDITPNVSTGQFDLKYDPNILSVTAVSSGSIGGTPVPIPPSSWQIITTGVPDGKYILRVIINQDTPAIGDGYFCQINFNSIATGTSALEFVEGEGSPSGWLLLNDGAFPPNELIATWMNGSVTVQ